MRIRGIVKAFRRKQNMSDEEFKKFLRDIARIDENGCWITDLYVMDRIRFPDRRTILYKGKRMGLHRLSYQLFKGEIFPNLVVMHICDRGYCFNPEHLKLGTQKENVTDAISNGLRVYSKNNTSKLYRIGNPYYFDELLAFIKQVVAINDKDEWLYQRYIPKNGYPQIRIKNKFFTLHKLVLANKLNKPYEDIQVACHRLPDGSRPQRHDLNPEHLFEASQAENIKDTLHYRKGVKLTFQIAEQIRKEAFQYNGLITHFDKLKAMELNVQEDVIRRARLGITFKKEYGHQSITKENDLNRFILNAATYINPDNQKEINTFIHKMSQRHALDEKDILCLLNKSTTTTRGGYSHF